MSNKREEDELQQPQTYPSNFGPTEAEALSQEMFNSMNENSYTPQNVGQARANQIWQTLNPEKEGI